MYHGSPTYPHGQLPPQARIPQGPRRNPHATVHRYRVRWDNLVIVGLALAACAIGVPFLLHGNASPNAGGSSHRYSQPASIEPADSVDESLTLEEANQLVARAREAMLAGRFEDAANLLSSIGGTVSDQSGASALRDENARRQAEFEQGAAEAMRAVDDEQWAQAVQAFAEVREIAPLTNELAAAERTAKLHAGTDRVIAAATEQLDEGNTAKALKVARSGYRSLGTEELAALVKRIEGLLRQEQAPAGSGGTATTGSSTGLSGSTPATGSSSTGTTTGGGGSSTTMPPTPTVTPGSGSTGSSGTGGGGYSSDGGPTAGPPNTHGSTPG